MAVYQRVRQGGTEGGGNGGGRGDRGVRVCASMRGTEKEKRYTEKEREVGGGREDERERKGERKREA